MPTLTEITHSHLKYCKKQKIHCCCLTCASLRTPQHKYNPCDPCVICCVSRDILHLLHIHIHSHKTSGSFSFSKRYKICEKNGETLACYRSSQPSRNYFLPPLLFSCIICMSCKKDNTDNTGNTNNTCNTAKYNEQPYGK